MCSDDDTTMNFNVSTSRPFRGGLTNECLAFVCGRGRWVPGPCLARVRYTLWGPVVQHNIIGCPPAICRKFYNVYELHREAYINPDYWTCANDNAIQWFTVSSRVIVYGALMS